LSRANRRSRGKKKEGETLNRPISLLADERGGKGGPPLSLRKRGGEAAASSLGNCGKKGEGAISLHAAGERACRGPSHLFYQIEKLKQDSKGGIVEGKSHPLINDFP